MGRFVPVTVKDRRYWYFDQPTGEGKQARRYVGPADDQEITKRVETFKEIKDHAKARRKLVVTLTREQDFRPLNGSRAMLSKLWPTRASSGCGLASSDRSPLRLTALCSGSGCPHRR